MREKAFLEFVAARGDNPMDTVWGAYRHFDGYALAALAVGDAPLARRLLAETLDMIDQNFADERADPTKKWHLADFAMHPLLRAWFTYRATHFPDDPIWERLAATARNFRFHYGDLSENHNFLHLTLRHLVGQTWPNAVLADGRTGAEHHADSRDGIERWLRDWATRGSAEWGADIYYNVNLLSLLNLFDYSADDAIRRAARGVLDLLALDEALDAFSGSSVGAARRSYSVYRMDVRQSPARPLHFLWFDATIDEPFNTHFIGGVIQAAISEYRPPEAIVWIANDRTPQENRATHLPGVWDGSAVDHLGKHTLRLPEVMQSVMQSPGGSGGRYTEHVWQITMGDEALVFANHPTLVTPVHPEQNTRTIDEIHAIYARPRPAEPPVAGSAWYWTYAHVPPGHSGDVRPGYWQGNGTGPRTFGTGPLAFLLFDIPADDPLPWAHLYLPRAAFEAVDDDSDDDHWVFLRRGDGYAALWLPSGFTRTTDGFWADTELRLNAPRAAVLSFIGNADRDGSFDAFQARARALRPKWDVDTATLSALPEPDASEDERLSVSYANGPERGGKPISTRGARFETPWGSMPLGSSRFELRTPAGDWSLDLGPDLPRDDQGSVPSIEAM